MSINMNTVYSGVRLRALVKRNIKVFFKDKGAFFTSLISPLILLVLFVTFLKDVYTGSFQSMMPEGVVIEEKIVNSFAGSWLMASILGVSAVTVAFCSNMLMVQDRLNGAFGDFAVAPVKKSTLSLSYYLANLAVTAIICYTALCVGFIYLGVIGWYFEGTDVLLLLADTAVNILFGTAFAALVDGFLNSQGGISAVGTIVSSMYGFLCGAYMPISQLSPAIGKFVSLLPGTYGAGLLRKHFLNAPLRELSEICPEEVLTGLKNGFDVNMQFFGTDVPSWAMYVVLIAAACVFIALYVFFTKRRNNKD